MKEKEFFDWLLAHVDNEGNVQVEGVASQFDGMIDFFFPLTNFKLHVKNDGKTQKNGEKVILSIQAGNLLGWLPFVLATEAVKNYKPDPEVVYVLLLENRTVKIGRTKNFDRRIKAISTSSGMKVLKQWKTESIPSEESSRVENMAHRHFKQKRKLGEFFEIDFDVACSYVDSLLTA